MGLEGLGPGEPGLAPEVLLDAQQAVVLGGALRPAGAPVLIWPQSRATAMSAMVVSSLSPERWLTMTLYPALEGDSSAASMRLGDRPDLVDLQQEWRSRPRHGTASAQRLRVGDEEVVAHDLQLACPSSLVSSAMVSNASSSNGSSRLIRG